MNTETGSSLYYSLLWTDESARARYVNRLHLIQALNSTLDDVQDPQKKIHWWHEEIERMISTEARHPATKACQSDIPHDKEAALELHTLVSSACLAILSSVSNVRYTPPATDDERNEQLVANYSGRLALLSHALSRNVEDLSLESHPPIACQALAQHEQLSRLPTLLHRGQPVFSTANYKTHNISPKDLASGIRVAAVKVTDSAVDSEAATVKRESDRSSQTSFANIPIVDEKPGTDTILQSAINETLSCFSKAYTSPKVLQRYRQAPLLPVWRMIALRRKQVTLWQKKQPNLLREQMSLTPLSKFFCAWRHRR